MESPPISIISTAVASASGRSSTLPPQASLPPIQPWCPSQISRAGAVSTAYIPLYKVAELNQSNTQTVPNGKPRPAVFRLEDPLSINQQSIQPSLTGFVAINGTTITEGAVEVGSDFSGEGLELEPDALTDFNPTPVASRIPSSKPGLA